MGFESSLWGSNVVLSVTELPGLPEPEWRPGRSSEEALSPSLWGEQCVVV